MIHSGSVCSIITKTVSKKKLKNAPCARWVSIKRDKDLKTCSNELINVQDKTATKVIYNNWICEDACLTVVEDHHKLTIGREFSSSLGLAVVQQQAIRSKCINNIDNSICVVKQTIESHFPHLVSRICLSKTHVVKSKFDQMFTAKHQKSRRVTNILQPRVTGDLDRLKKEGLIEKLSSCFDKTWYYKV